MKTASFITTLVCASMATVALFVPSIAQKSGAEKPAAAGKTIQKAVTPIPSKGFSGELTEIAKSNYQWTGIAVSKKNRVFVCYPRWSNIGPVSTGELLPDGSVSAFPDKKWNEWIQGGKVTGEEFICVQSVYCDSNGILWILDPAAPRFQGPITNGPKLVKVNLASNRVEKYYPLDEVAPKDCYLNDVRIDTRRQVAYMTDSGLGAIVVLDLRTGNARRVLETSPSVKAENVKVMIDGKRWGVLSDGSVRKVHSDGIALDKTGDYLYYQALTGKTLYRVATKELRNEKLAAKDLNAKVEKVATTCPADGIEFGADGKLYITSIEDSSIKSMNVNGANKELTTVIKDKQLVWPDSLAQRGDGYFYVTCSQINLGPKAPTPYKIFRFKPTN
jgi:sugar lactone lactonase YvrE